ncbi:MAG: hypothetical protein HZC51_09470 [Nitrospirae bacterium]|nr:hypothetical protein [Nitrospirota bacterium]
MSKFKMMFMVVLATVMTLGFAGMASAATIACGDCHGTAATDDPLPVNADNCANTGRGLHGVHVNYSSVSMPKTVASYGKCGYCHTATATKAPSTSHNNNYVNVTTTATAPGLDYTTATATCTNACHKNEAATAKWGNYTSASIQLSCNSCHDDSAAAANNLSGAHGKHLDTTVTVTGLGAGTNADCDACHPNNVNDWSKVAGVDAGTAKAYSHAADGTNVVSDNASLDAGLSASRGAGSTDTCAASCHPRSATIQWGQSMTCNSCHYQEDVPASANNTGTGNLGGSHNAHFDQGAVCSDCHTVPGAGDTAHASALPTVQDNATITRTGLSYNDGANTCTFSSNGASCHGNGNTTPAWGNPSSIPSCAICHNYPTVAGKDWAAGNGHYVRYDAPVVNTHLKASGFDASGATAYATQVGVGGSCNTCHSGGTHRNGTADVAGNGNGNCGGNFSITVTTPGSDATCSNVKCHSGKTTPNWW